MDGTQHPHIMVTLLSELNPQIVIVKTSDRQMKGIELCSKIKKVGSFPKIIWINEKSNKVDPEVITANGIDRVLFSPVEIRELTGIISELGKINPKTLQLSNIAGRQVPLQADNDIIIVRGEDEDSQEVTIVKDHGRSLEKPHKPNFRVSSCKVQDRSDRYKLFLEDQEPLEKKYFSRGSVASLTQKIRDRWDEELETKLKAERQRFIEILFSEKRESND